MLSPEDLSSKLEAFLRQQGVAARVTAARRLTGGASRDTWAVDAFLDGQPAGLVVRRDLGGEIQDEALSRAAEFAVLRRAHAGGVLVPRPRWLCEDREVLGAAFFVMDRLDGESVGRRVVKHPSASMLPAKMGEQLAKIHALPLDGLDFLPRPADGVSPAKHALDRAAAQYLALGEPHPAIDLGLRWLSKHVPSCERLVLVHGDFRVGNLMVGPTGLVGVFDWEFAHVGDPAEDLAWPCVRSWRFGNDNLKLGGVGRPDAMLAAYGRPVDPAALLFWEILGNLRWAVGCVAQAHRHLSGQAPSVELASLGRRACEMELELLDLIGDAEKAP